MIDFIIIGSSFLLRWLVSMGPYSGKGKAPMFGDYEAQRHWMEITNNLPVEKWYFFDLPYWGLDYPPLTAYHMQWCGRAAQLLNPAWVALNTSRGYESLEHAIFMRSTVLIGDFVMLVPAALLVKREFGLLGMLGLLFNPTLILVDHGHFQYNSISLSLSVIAACLVSAGRNMRDRCVGCMLFTMSLFYKQMSLYHAFPFFFILIGHSWRGARRSLCDSLREVALYGVVVLSTSLILLSPFLLFAPNPMAQVLQIAHRLFPFARGLFEDKVASVWCTLNSAIKIRQVLSVDGQIKLATGATLVSAILPSLPLLRDQSRQAMMNAMVQSALAFFLFSFQVHEKQCLLFALPASLMINTNLAANALLVHTALFSLLPLAAKDKLLGYYLALRIMSVGVMILMRGLIKKDLLRINRIIPGVLGGRQGGFAAPLGALLLFQEILFYLIAFEAPPRRFPDMWPVLISTISCGVFTIYYLSNLALTLTYSESKPVTLDPIHRKILANRQKKQN